MFLQPAMIEKKNLRSAFEHPSRVKYDLGLSPNCLVVSIGTQSSF